MKKYWIPAGAALLLVIVSIVFLIRPGDDQTHKAIPNKQLVSSRSVSRPEPPPLLPDRSSHPVEPVAKASPPKRSQPTKEQVPADEEYQDPQKELEYVLNKMFEEEAKEIFPLHTVQTFNPVEPELYGPKEGEVWIRIKVEHSREHKEIMAQVADLYKDVARYDKPVTVMLWVGNRPWAKFRYPSLEENEGASEFIEDEDSSP